MTSTWASSARPRKLSPTSARNDPSTDDIRRRGSDRIPCRGSNGGAAATSSTAAAAPTCSRRRRRRQAVSRRRRQRPPPGRRRRRHARRRCGSRRVDGGIGNDRLTGGGGNDAVRGGDGDDSSTTARCTPSTAATASKGGRETTWWATSAGPHPSASASTPSPTTARPAKATTSAPTSKRSTAATQPTSSSARPPRTGCAGRGGDDRISGAGGMTSSTGDSGNDQIDGGDGNDTLDGGCHDDTIVGGPGVDSLDSDGMCADPALRGCNDVLHARDGVKDSLVLRTMSGTPETRAIVDPSDPALGPGNPPAAPSTRPRPYHAAWRHETTGRHGHPGRRDDSRGQAAREARLQRQPARRDGRSGQAVPQLANLKASGRRSRSGRWSPRPRARWRPLRRSDRGKTINLGTTAVTVKPRSPRTLSITLSRKGKAALRRGKNARIKVSFTVHHPTTRKILHRSTKTFSVAVTL